jgi:hypothetical protein
MEIIIRRAYVWVSGRNKFGFGLLFGGFFRLADSNSPIGGFPRDDNDVEWFALCKQIKKGIERGKSQII